jgi:uncharacterized protein (UPF0332 family)
METARDLAQNSREADWRSSISRGYYAIYNHFRKILADGVPGPTLKKGDLSSAYMGHDKLVRALRNCDEKDVRSLGSALNDMKSERRRADYLLDEKVDRQRAKNALEELEDILTEIDTVTHVNIAKAVKEHLNKPFKTIER